MEEGDCEPAANTRDGRKKWKASGRHDLLSHERVALAGEPHAPSPHLCTRASRAFSPALTASPSSVPATAESAKPRTLHMLHGYVCGGGGREQWREVRGRSEGRTPRRCTLQVHFRAHSSWP